MKIDKVVLAKAIGIMALGWLALPIVYVLLMTKEKKNGSGHVDKSGDAERIDLRGE